jgi:hypothetical protein
MRKLFLFAAYLLSIFAVPAMAQTNKPDWSVNPSSYEQGMDVTIQMFFGTTAVTSGGMVGAFIDGVLQGVKDGGSTGPSGKFVFITRVYGNAASGKTITFKFYDTSRDKVYLVTETVTFASDGIVGDALNPQVLHCVLGNDASLSDLLVTGSTISGFSPAVLTYTFAVSSGTVVPPVVTATPTDLRASLDISHAAAIPGSTTVVVTAENGQSQITYTINFVFGTSNVATLSDLRVNGSTVTGFSPAILSYQVVLSHNTVVVPTVTATTTDTKATKVVHAAASLPGSTTVVVTAEDGSSTKTYTIDFTKEPDSDATLSDLKVNGTTVAGFAPGTIVYSVVLPHNTVEIPVIAATTTDPNASKTITQAATVNGTATVLVRAEDAVTTRTYTVNFSVAPDNDATLSDLKVNGTTISGFVPATLTYNITLPAGTSAIPVITGTTNDPNASKLITQPASVSGTGTIAVTAEDGSTKKTYTINFSVGKSNVATLSDLKTDGTTISGFSAATLNYQVVLPHSTLSAPVISATTTDSNATKVITQAAALPGTATVVVTAEDGIATRTYSVGFSKAPDNDAKLSDLKVNGTTIVGFAATTYTYFVTFPFGATAVPVIAATTSDPLATKSITQPVTVSGTGTVLVTAEDGTTKNTYTIVFSVTPPSSDATLSDLAYNGTTVPGFHPGTFVYNIVLPEGTVAFPVITSTTTHSGATKVTVNPTSLPGAGTVTVTAQNGTTVLLYTILFRNHSISSDATLSDLKVNGTTVAGFSTSVLAYSVLLPYNAAAVPTVTATTTDAGASKVITPAASLPGTTTVVVTAENGISVKTYTINFTLASASSDATLSNLTVNGPTITDFSPWIISYTYELPFGTTQVPVVNGTTTHPGATKVITAATEIPGRTIVMVTAQDGTTKKAYSIDFILAKNTDATLKELKISGNLVAGFLPATLLYNYVVSWETIQVPPVTAVATDAKANVFITNALELPGATTVVVVAEDGVTIITYEVRFRFPFTGIDQSDELSTFNIYPNPSKGEFSIRYFNSQYFDNKIDVKVTNILGSVVYRQIITQTGKDFNIPVNISGCKPGVYFIHVKNGNEIKSKTILIN